MTTTEGVHALTAVLASASRTPATVPWNSAPLAEVAGRIVAAPAMIHRSLYGPANGPLCKSKRLLSSKDQ